MRKKLHHRFVLTSGEVQFELCEKRERSAKVDEKSEYRKKEKTKEKAKRGESEEVDEYKEEGSWKRDQGGDER